MPLKGKRLRFGDFVFDADELVLSHDAKPVALPPKALKLLYVLLENRGRIVEKADLMHEVWQDAFVEEGNITYTVRLLRKTLNDDSHSPQYIETVPKRGYRFIGHVESEGAPTGDSSALIASRNFGKNPLIGAAIVIAVALGVWTLWPRHSGSAQPPPEKIMLAVLPFQNLMGDESQEYFSDGLTEEMITRLGSMDPNRLGVIGRTSVMHYKNSPATIDQIGRELQVQYVLEGSVRRDANRLRVAAQLIQTTDQTHVWAREYDREITDLLTLQDSMAQEVAASVQSTLEPKPSPTTATLDLEAYDLYLKGQYFFNKRGAENLQQAVVYFEAATKTDPSFARAYAGLADAYSLLSGSSDSPKDEFISRAREAARRAIEIDPNSAEAHTALALIVQNYDWDWQTAEKEFRRAIDLEPNYSTAHHWYAEHLALLGRFDDALHESELARQLDPLSLAIATDNGEILYFSRQYDRSIQKLRDVQQMEPGFIRSHIIVNAYTAKGMFSEAFADIEQWRKTIDQPWSWAELAYVSGRSGHVRDARSAVNKLLELNKHQPIDASLLFWAYTGMGDREHAFEWLEKAYGQRANILLRLRVDPAFDSLRGDPRFQNFLARVHLAD